MTTEVRTLEDLILNTHVQNPHCKPPEHNKEPDFSSFIVLNPADLRAAAFTTRAANPENLCSAAS